jgi:hypothetical protein
MVLGLGKEGDGYYGEVWKESVVKRARAVAVVQLESGSSRISNLLCNARYRSMVHVTTPVLLAAASLLPEEGLISIGGEGEACSAVPSVPHLLLPATARAAHSSTDHSHNGACRPLSNAPNILTHAPLSS